MLRLSDLFHPITNQVKRHPSGHSNFGGTGFPVTRWRRRRDLCAMRLYLLPSSMLRICQRFCTAVAQMMALKVTASGMTIMVSGSTIFTV